MMHTTDAIRTSIRGLAEPSHRRSIPLFWLVLGGLLIFAGSAAILYYSHVWSRADVSLAEAVVLVALGVILVVTAVIHASRVR